MLHRRTLLTITEWNVSRVITDRKSRFQARHVPLTDPKDIPGILEQFLAQHKSIQKNASHPHMIAWRVGERKLVDQSPVKSKSRKKDKSSEVERYEYVNIQQGFNDNGEGGAGYKMLEQVLVQNNLFNILLIATRWYGGSPIGGLRFRHINQTCFESVASRLNR